MINEEVEKFRSNLIWVLSEDNTTVSYLSLQQIVRIIDDGETLVVIDVTNTPHKFRGMSALKLRDTLGLPEPKDMHMQVSNGR